MHKPLMLCFVLVCALLNSAWAEPVRVQQKQGAIHGFLLLKSTDGAIIATGDQTVVTRAGTIHSRLLFHFKDGSLDDEVTVYRQSTNLELVSDHHVQKGPSFPTPLDLRIDMRNQLVVYTETKDGKAMPRREHVDLPSDLSNGLVSVVLGNYPAVPRLTVSYLVISSGPRIVKLEFQPDGEDHFTIAGSSRLARRFRVHTNITGLPGLVAPIIGKQPKDMLMWTSNDDVLSFLRMEGALYDQGPTWNMELTSPVW